MVNAQPINLGSGQGLEELKDRLMQEIARPNIFLIELISLHNCVLNSLYHRGSRC